MNIRTLINRLDEINRRDFLKGLGAAAGTAAAGKIPNFAPAAASMAAPAIQALSSYDLGEWANTPWAPLIKSLLNGGFDFKNIIKSIIYDASLTDTEVDQVPWSSVLTDKEETDLENMLGPLWEEEINNEANKFNILAKLNKADLIATLMGTKEEQKTFRERLEARGKFEIGRIQRR